MLTAHSCSTYFSLFLCGIDTSPFPRKTLSCMRGVPLLFLSCEGAQRLQSVKDRRPDVVGGKGVVSVQCILKATGSGAASSSLESRRLRLAPPFDRPASGFLHWNRVPALYCPSLIITMRAVSRIFQRFSRLHTASAAEALVEHCRARAPRVVKPQSLAISENMLAQWRRTSGRWP